jgi:hypothetical protein
MVRAGEGFEGNYAEERTDEREPARRIEEGEDGEEGATAQGSWKVPFQLGKELTYV